MEGHVQRFHGSNPISFFPSISLAMPLSFFVFSPIPSIYPFSSSPSPHTSSLLRLFYISTTISFHITFRLSPTPTLSSSAISYLMSPLFFSLCLLIFRSLHAPLSVNLSELLPVSLRVFAHGVLEGIMKRQIGNSKEIFCFKTRDLCFLATRKYHLNEIIRFTSKYMGN